MVLATFGQWAFVIGLILGGFVVVLFMTSSDEKENRQVERSERDSREERRQRREEARRRRGT